VSAPPRRVVLYTVAHDCPLCDEALAHLDSLRAAHARAFALEVVVVDRDPRLAIRHALRVPVVEVDGVEVLHGKIARADLERVLRVGTQRSA